MHENTRYKLKHIVPDKRGAPQTSVPSFNGEFERSATVRENSIRFKSKKSLKLFWFVFRSLQLIT